MKKALEIFKKHTMLIVLVLVVLFFTITTGCSMVSSANFYSLITHNAHVYV